MYFATRVLYTAVTFLRHFVSLNPKMENHGKPDSKRRVLRNITVRRLRLHLNYQNHT